MRHYIPITVMGESLHGVMNPEATIFPQSIALGATFNDELIGEIADKIGKEAYALGIRQVFAPNLDISRDPRWGRNEETFGEDPYLVSRMGAAYVKGIQKNDVASTLKHFIAYSIPEGGLNLAPSHLGERELREILLPPFEVGVKSGAMAIMPAYGEYDGVPIHSSEFILRNILRGELNFSGVTISDFGAVTFLHTLHKTAENALEAGKQALKAGVDIDAPDQFGYGEDFRQAARTGKIDVGLIDDAVCRILMMKCKLGLFEEEKKTFALHSSEAVSLAQRAAEESMVLLKNEEILPFRKNIKKIALIGPNADEIQFGDYTYYRDINNKHKTLRSAFESRFGTQNILYAKGSGIAERNEEWLKAAESCALQSDVAVVVLGDNSKFFGGYRLGG